MKRREFIKMGLSATALAGIPSGGCVLQSATKDTGPDPAKDPLGRQDEAVSFSELPLDLKLPSTQIRGKDWTENAMVVQPWGKTQIQMMNDRVADKPRLLQERYGFNTICVMPPAALAAVGGGQQSEVEFTDGLTAYRAAGYRIILYSSLVNMGHDPSWYTILHQHPEWRQIDPSGASANWLCPNNPGVLELATTYTDKLIRRYHADGVMFDNNAFNIITTRAPACYCSGCTQKFGAYVASRFGKLTKPLFGVPAGKIKIPSTPGPLYNLWKYWRCRSWAEIMEQVRKALPDTVLFANAQYGYWTAGNFGWFLGDDLLYPHEDMMLSESYSMTPRAVSSKMNLGRALAQNRPLFDLVGTFQWKPPQFSTLKPADVIRQLTAASLLHTANPWVVYYGMEGDDFINAASREALSQILSFRARHPDFYTNLQAASSVCSILPLNSYTQLGTSHPVVPTHVATLAEAGIAVTGVCDLNLHSENLSRFSVVVAEHTSCVDAAGAGNLARWVQNGGTLITTSDLAIFDEIGRRRPRSKVADDLKLGGLSTQPVGAGIIRVVSPNDIPGRVLQVARGNIEALNAAPHTIEFQPYLAAKNRLLLHMINYSSRMTTSWKIQLPGALASGITGITLYRPEELKGVRLQWVDRQIDVPAINAYAVIEIVRPE